MKKLFMAIAVMFCACLTSAQNIDDKVTDCEIAFDYLATRYVSMHDDYERLQRHMDDSVVKIRALEEALLFCASQYDSREEELMDSISFYKLTGMNIEQWFADSVATLNAVIVRQQEIINSLQTNTQIQMPSPRRVTIWGTPVTR